MSDSKTSTWYNDAIQVELGASATTWENYGAGGGPNAITGTGKNATLNVGTKILADVAAATATPYDATVQSIVPTIVNADCATATAVSYDATIAADLNVSATLASATGSSYAATVQADVDTNISVGSLALDRFIVSADQPDGFRL